MVLELHLYAPQTVISRPIRNRRLFWQSETSCRIFGPGGTWGLARRWISGRRPRWISNLWSRCCRPRKKLLPPMLDWSLAFWGQAVGPRTPRCNLHLQPRSWLPPESRYDVPGYLAWRIEYYRLFGSPDSWIPPRRGTRDSIIVYRSKIQICLSMVNRTIGRIHLVSFLRNCQDNWVSNWWFHLRTMCVLVFREKCWLF